MEEQKDTKNIWIVMTITFFTVSIVFGILLYQSEKVIKEMQQTVAESVTVQEQQDVNASADSVRLMDGMVQVQKDKEWVDYCTIEEFTQSDPVEAGKQKMSDLIKSNQDVVNAGTLLEDVNSEFAMLEKAATREVIMEPQTEVSWKMETDNTTDNPNKKKDNGKNMASKVNGKNQAGKGNTVSGQNTAGAATPAETQPGADTSMQQPASGTSSGSTPAAGNTSTGNNAASGGSSSGGGSSAGSSSSSGGGAPAGNTTPSGGTANTPSSGADSGNNGASGGSAGGENTSGGSSDTNTPSGGSSGSTGGSGSTPDSGASSGGGNSDSDSGNSGSGSSGGDGEDIGWTDDIL